MGIPDQREAKAAVVWSRYGVNWDELDEPTRALLLPLRAPHPILSPVPRIAGHAYRVERGVGWCSCGAYMGGLGEAGEDLEEPPSQRHELHRAVVHARATAISRANEPTLF